MFCNVILDSTFYISFFNFCANKNSDVTQNYEYINLLEFIKLQLVCLDQISYLANFNKAHI